MARKHLSLAVAAVLACVAGQARAACKLAKLAEMPVTMVGSNPIVTAQINGQDARFALDSGAFFSVIATSSAKRFKSPIGPAPDWLSLRGVGGTAETRLTTAKTFTFVGHPFHQVDFLVGADNILGGQYDGLLGQNVLMLGDNEFDLANGAVRLFRAEGCNGGPIYWAKDAPQTVQEVRIEGVTPMEPHIIGTAMVNGHRIRVMFDSGANTSVLKLAAAARVGITPQSAGVEEAGLSGGIGRHEAETWTAPVESFQIGDEQIKNTRLRIARMDTDVDMLLGADFFLSHRIYISREQHRLWFTYNGGPVFDLRRRPPPHPTQIATASQAQASTPTPTAQTPTGQAPSPPAAEPAAAPTDAAGYARRGAAYFARRQLAEALADYSKAVQLDPQSFDYIQQRALVRAAMGRPVLAMADLDQALKLKPDDVGALMLRGRLLLVNRDIDRAKLDFAAADKAGVDDPGLGLQIAAAYLQADQFELALAQYDGWIAARPRDERLSTALVGRCATRAIWGRDLDKALADCNRAMNMGRDNYDTFDARALVRYRMGDLDRAIADYSTAIRLQPKAAMSLYGRGLAELKKGDSAKGQADIDAATAIAPHVGQRLKRLGIVPGAPGVPAAPAL